MRVRSELREPKRPSRPIRHHQPGMPDSIMCFDLATSTKICYADQRQILLLCPQTLLLALSVC